MKKGMMIIGCLVLLFGVAAAAISGQAKGSPERGYGWDCPYGRGYGPGMHHGYGRHHGEWYGRGGMGAYGDWHLPRDWESMTPEQQDKWNQMWSQYKMDTLDLRKQLVTKRMELETLWDQPEADPQRIEKLSDEVADLKAELEKKRNKFLTRCRKEFSDKDWACPGG